MIDPSAQQEQFSRAYVHAVATVAGFSVASAPTPDDDSVDLSIAHRGPMGRARSPRVDVQLKSVRDSVVGDPWAYPLKVKNYEELRHADYLVPRILVVVSLPRDPSEWMHQSETELALRHCGYWVSLRGMPTTTNDYTVSVTIPRKQVFSVAELHAMFRRIGQGELP